MIKKSIFLAVAFVLLANTQAQAGSLTDDMEIKARAGWNIGGTAPLGLPATIRSIDKFKPSASFLFGVDVQKPLGGKWGLQAGLHFENKAMDGDVTTKLYRMELVQGKEKLEGLFTGKVHQEVNMWMLTLPVQATLKVSDKLQLKAGPYFSLLTSKEFNGIASDGYLREGNPTGMKIMIGDKEGEWATYDFSDSMRNFQMGIGVGLDWQFYQNFGLGLDLNWGLNGIFESDFKTVEQTLYPIYGSISVFYRLK